MDQHQFNEIVHKYAPVVFNIAYRYTGNYQDAYDISQETFLKLLKNYNPKRVLSENSLNSWFYKVVRNLSINLITRDKMKQKSVSLYDSRDGGLKENIESISDSCPNPQQIMEKDELGKIIQEKLRELPEDFRMAVILKDIQALSYEEISDIMSCSVGTVKSRLFRGRKILADSLKNYI